MNAETLHILSLDTTSRHSSISVSRGDDVRVEYNFTSLDSLSTILIPALEFVLKSVDMKPGDIDVYGITTGPGLFTGIRVGLSALKGLLFGLGKPVVPVTTPRALAHKCMDMETGSTIIPLIDARRDEVYFAVYKRLDVTFEDISPPRLISIDDLPGNLDNVENLYFVGSGAEIHRAKIDARFGTGKIVSRSSFLAAETCKITYMEYLDGNYITDLQKLMPVYIRKPDAELNFRHKDTKTQKKHSL